MTSEQRVLLKQRIQDEIKKVSSEISQLEDVTKPISPENAIGRVSRMDAMSNKLVNEQVLSSARIRKNQLETMFEKADRADFGVCLACQMPISIDRILAIPETELCVKCASY